MKTTATFLLLFLYMTTGAQKIQVSKGADGGVWLINPVADTIVFPLSVSPVAWVYAEGIKGKSNKPVVIINEGGVVHVGGFTVKNSQYLKITGSGTAQKYGFYVSRPNAVGVDVTETKVKGLEVERIFFEGLMYGIRVKNEAHCDPTVNAWVLDSFYIHDSKFRNQAYQDMYLGSTDQINEARSITCNGQTISPQPSKLGNFKITNNVHSSTGKAAIQLCGAKVGMSEIANNTIDSAGLHGEVDQGCGIVIGTFTRAYIHHNKVRRTLTWGIASLGGSGDVRIEYNDIAYCGYNGIVVDTRKTTPVDFTTFVIKGNVINATISPNIHVGKQFATYTNNNQICGNTSNGYDATLYVANSVSFSSCTVLPVKLEYFFAYKNNRSVLLKWKGEEHNFSHYEIERSRDGQTFFPIGKIRGGIGTYQTLDLVPDLVNFYRLKMVDVDGSVRYSEIRAVRFSSKWEYTIDQLGRRVDLSRAAAGMYFKIYTDGTREIIFKNQHQ